MSTSLVKLDRKIASFLEREREIISIVSVILFLSLVFEYFLAETF